MFSVATVPSFHPRAESQPSHSPIASQPTYVPRYLLSQPPTHVPTFPHPTTCQTPPPLYFNSLTHSHSHSHSSLQLPTAIKPPPLLTAHQHQHQHHSQPSRPKAPSTPSNWPDVPHTTSHRKVSIKPISRSHRRGVSRFALFIFSARYHIQDRKFWLRGLGEARGR